MNDELKSFGKLPDDLQEILDKLGKRGSPTRLLDNYFHPKTELAERAKRLYDANPTLILELFFSEKKELKPILPILQEYYVEIQDEWKEDQLKRILGYNTIKELHALSFNIRSKFETFKNIHPSYSIREFLETGKRIQTRYHIDNEHLIEENAFIYDLIDRKIKELTTGGNEVIESLEPHTPKLKWRGKKIELQELIFALWLSGDVTDESGEKATQEQLVKSFNDMFEVEGATAIDSNSLTSTIKGHYGKNKVRFDNEFAINKLESDYLSELKNMLIDDKDKKLD